MKRIPQQKRTIKIRNLGAVVKRFTAGFAACVTLLAGPARADTTITGTTTVTTPATWTTTAGSVTINNGATLQFQPTAQGTYPFANNLILAGSAGTINLGFKANDTIYTWNGSVTSTATGAQTLAITTGQSSNGDREEVTFSSGIPNGTAGNALSLQVTFNTQSGSYSFVNLAGPNTFTGPITLIKGSNVTNGYLTIGGRGIGNNSNQYAVTPGSGTLNGGNYAGAITLGTSTILSYASTATQTLSGVISGSGALQTSGTGMLTLSGVNSYSGNTTINSGGKLTLDPTGGLKFVVTDAATNNKITGAGTATINGTFTVDTTAVTVTSGTWTLVNTTTKSFGASFGLTNGVTSFTGPVSNVYTLVNGGQTWTFNTTTGVLSLSSQAIITAFGITGSAGTINQVAKTIALTVPYGTNLATLAPTFTLTSGTCNQTSGSAPSPTFAASNPVHYIVTGSVVSDYAVTVSVTPASSNKDILTFGLPGNAGVINGTNIMLTVPVSPGVTSLAPTYTVSQFATGSPLSGTALNFTSPQTYRITAQDGTFKDYLVTVQTYQAWTYSGSLFILTTPDGANIATGTAETDFPLLVRLNASNFTFSQAASDGKDIRFSTAAGLSLPYQIEQWDSVAGQAAVWVKIPSIAANARQEIKMYWGKSDAVSESDGTKVFNSANGFASVLHMNETVTDTVGNTTPANSGTTVTAGMIGKGRNFTSGNGITAGLSITTFPTGTNPPFSSEVWIRSSVSPTNIMGWGIEQGQGKVVMQFASPPHINMDCYFGGGNVTGASTLSTTQWVHLAHTYQGGSAKVYVNGVLDGTGPGGGMAIPTPARFYVGGWYGFNYVGDMDEVRISSVTRSANWIKMEYENQKPLQTMVGSLVQSGSDFSASPSSVTMNEGATTNLTGNAGGAQKVYWIYKKNGVETVLATDQLTYTVTAGRSTGGQSFDIVFRAVFPAGPQDIVIPVTVNEFIPDPVFTLTGPSTWDGRQTITITPDISNIASLPQGFANLTYSWSVAGVAVTKTINAGTPTKPGTLTLTRSQGSGPMTVTLVLDNGGAPVSNSMTIAVQEPATDAWVQRTPGATEKAVNNQFYARDPNTNKGTIYYNGTGTGATPVFLKVYATPDGGTETQYGTTLRQTPLPTAYAYAFAVPIDAGKIIYRLEFGTTSGGIDSVTATVTNLVCGDAYILQGQSNAVSTDSLPGDTTNSTWIRTYGQTTATWGNAVRNGSDFWIGYWGYDLADYLQTNRNMPICIINGAVGGTRIDQHQANPADHTVAGSSFSIYANLLNRVIGAKLTYGIRGIFWHQGENNSGAAAPTGDYDYKSYQQYFVDLAAAWKQDYPNIQRYIIYQVMPSPCSMGPKGDQLRDVQRMLPSMFSKMHILNTLGVAGYIGCHFSAAGYQNFADRTAPLVNQDFYGIVPGMSVTAPILQRAYYTNSARTEIALQFDQNMSWSSFSTANYWLDKVGSKVTSGSAAGNIVKLQLSSAGTATSTLDYLEDAHWSYTESTSSLLYGANGIPALTFADVAIAPSSPYLAWAANSAQGLTGGLNDGPLDDPDHDGISNLLEFALGGAPMVASRDRLPVSSPSGGNLVFEYDRSAASRPPDTTQIVEYSTNLKDWTPVTIPLSTSGSVAITPGATSDHVTVTVPVSGNNTFARLRVITN